jgi:hypothetical protein
MFRKAKKHIALLLLFCFGIILSENALHVYLLHDHDVLEATAHTCAYHKAPEQTAPPADTSILTEAEVAEACLRCHQFVVSVNFQIAESLQASYAPASDVHIRYEAKSPLKSVKDTKQNRGPPAPSA